MTRRRNSRSVSRILISEAQADVRRVYEGGFYGLLVQGAVWLVAVTLVVFAFPLRADNHRVARSTTAITTGK